MRIWSIFLVVVLSTGMAALSARADVPMTSTLHATSACPATPSIHRPANPGGMILTPGQDYAIIAANKTPPTHYLLLMPGASPERRWVETSCGTAQSATGDPSSPARSSPTGKSASPTHFVLALSWEPGFCAGHGDKPECAAETAGSFEASHFTLHGLWPDPNEYCGAAPLDIRADKDGDWQRLPAVSLRVVTRGRLDEAMPGTQSQLERHEWLKHGTCSGADMDGYFSRALDFVDSVNASPVREAFSSHVGQQLTLRTIRAAFDNGFGKGAGERIRLSCDRQGSRRLLTEITIGLEGDVMGKADLSTLIAAARPTNGGCDAGLVSAVH